MGRGARASISVGLESSFDVVGGRRICKWQGITGGVAAGSVAIGSIAHGGHRVASMDGKPGLAQGLCDGWD